MKMMGQLMWSLVVLVQLEVVVKMMAVSTEIGIVTAATTAAPIAAPTKTKRQTEYIGALWLYVESEPSS